jgi:O-antigen/teichoic acid export membrane protein
MFEENENTLKIASGTFWGGFGTAIFKIFSFIYIIYIASVASQQDIGIFFLSLSIIGTFLSFKTLGLPASLLRYVPYFEAKKQEKKAQDLIKIAYLVDIALGIFFSVLIFFLSDFIAQIYQNPNLSFSLKFICLFIFLDNLLGINSSLLQSKTNIKGMQASSISQVFFKLLITGFLFEFYGPSLQNLILGFLSGHFFAILVSFLLILKNKYIHFSKDSTVDFKKVDLKNKENFNAEGLSKNELLGQIFPLGFMIMFINIFYDISSNLGKALLGFFLPSYQANQEIAIYSLAFVLASNIMVLPVIIGNIFLPVISKIAGREDKKEISRTLEISQRWAFLSSIPFVIVMAIYAQEILVNFYSPAYSSGSSLLFILSFAFLFLAFGLMINLTFAGLRLVKIEAIVALFSMLLNLILCIILIPKFGAQGAALGLLFSFIFMLLLLIFYSKKILNYTIPKDSSNLVFSFLFVFGFIYITKPILNQIYEFLLQYSIFSIPYSSKFLFFFFIGAIILLGFLILAIILRILSGFKKEDVEVLMFIGKRLNIPKDFLNFAKYLIFGRSE